MGVGNWSAGPASLRLNTEGWTGRRSCQSPLGPRLPNPRKKPLLSIFDLSQAPAMLFDCGRHLSLAGGRMAPGLLCLDMLDRMRCRFLPDLKPLLVR